MVKWDDKEKLNYIKKAMIDLEGLNGLFFDSLHWQGDTESSDRHNFVCKIFSDYIYKIMVVLNVYDDDEIVL